MRTHTVFILLIPIILVGCATQQTQDTQADAAINQINTLRQANERLAAAQQAMEARMSRLESEQTLLANRLSHTDTAGAVTARDIEALRAEAGATQAALGTLGSRLDSQSASVASAQETANDAVKIARDSRLVSGKVVDTLLLNESMVSYGYEQPELTAPGRDALDQLIASVRPKLPHVFVEIIGFTDSLSLDSQNRRIALERAESVRRYLHETGGIPLDRMSTISYGDARPVASTRVFSGQSENRRVLVQVLK